MSPELVLVDPALGEHARAALFEAEDTLARVDALILASRMTALAQRTARSPAEWDSHPVRRDGRRRRSAAFAGCAAAATLTVALLVGVRVDLRGSPAGADTAATVEAPVVIPTQPPPAAARPSPVPATPVPQAGRTEPQRFAWAPVPGASAYHIELFRGSSKVFEADTKQAAMTIPPSWTFAGRTYSLVPGEYRWNVWPVFSGQRAARAIVQAQLVIRGR